MKESEDLYLGINFAWHSEYLRGDVGHRKTLSVIASAKAEHDWSLDVILGHDPYAIEVLQIPDDTLRVAHPARCCSSCTT